MSSLVLLHLTLHRAPFEVMVTGEKPYEYRNPSQWIKSRLYDKQGQKRHYDAVRFVNGFGPDKPAFTAEYVGVEFVDSVLEQYSNGLTIDVENVFAIKLGKILSVENYVLPAPISEKTPKTPKVAPDYIHPGTGSIPQW